MLKYLCKYALQLSCPFNFNVRKCSAKVTVINRSLENALAKNWDIEINLCPQFSRYKFH